jgi:hypothetical protein
VGVQGWAVGVQGWAPVEAGGAEPVLVEVEALEAVLVGAAALEVASVEVEEKAPIPLARTYRRNGYPAPRQRHSWHTSALHQVCRPLPPLGDMQVQGWQR